MKPLVAIALVGLSACGKGSEPGPVASPPASSTTAEAPATAAATSSAPAAVETAPAAPPPDAKAPNGKILSADILAKVCGRLCGGPTASVQVYRDASGKVARLYRIHGSCSHPPGIYFSPDGQEGDTIAEKPIAPGSAEAKRFEAIHASNTKDLTLTDSVSCRDGSRSAP